MGRPSGSLNKDKPFREALRKRIAQAKERPGVLERIAGVLLKQAEAGDVQAIKEVADRLDGKVAQSLKSDSEGGPLQIQIVRFSEDGDA